MNIVEASDALATLEGMVAAVKGHNAPESKFAEGPTPKCVARPLKYHSFSGCKMVALSTPWAVELNRADSSREVLRIVHIFLQELRNSTRPLMLLARNRDLVPGKHWFGLNSRMILRRDPLHLPPSHRRKRINPAPDLPWMKKTHGPGKPRRLRQQGDRINIQSVVGRVR